MCKRPDKGLLDQSFLNTIIKRLWVYTIVIFASKVVNIFCESKRYNVANLETDFEPISLRMKVPKKILNIGNGTRTSLYKITNKG